MNAYLISFEGLDFEGESIVLAESQDKAVEITWNAFKEHSEITYDEWMKTVLVSKMDTDTNPILFMDLGISI